jgi:hypothetical protein
MEGCSPHKNLLITVAMKGLKGISLVLMYAAQQNGVVERRNSLVVAMARALLKQRNMPSEFFGEAMTTAVYLLVTHLSLAKPLLKPGTAVSLQSIPLSKDVWMSGFHEEAGTSSEAR